MAAPISTRAARQAPASEADSARRSGRGAAAAAVAGAAALLLVYLSAVLGLAVVAPPARAAGERAPRKVFGIGLSRTGTTSLTLALSQLGLRAYHALPALVAPAGNCASAGDVGANYSRFVLRGEWSDAFDALTDIHASVVFESLAERYPNALFVLTDRADDAWARSMTSFCASHGGPIHFSQALYERGLFHFPAVDLFDAMYGRGWSQHPLSGWAELCRSHRRRVEDWFAAERARRGGASRLLVLDVSQGASAWDALVAFLGAPGSESAGLPRRPSGFPRADVFELMATTQILWQLDWFASRAARFLAVAASW
jgi:hypothetical protein